MGSIITRGSRAKRKYYVKYKDIDGRWKMRLSHKHTKSQAAKYLAQIEARVADGRIGIEEDVVAPLAGELMEMWAQTLTNRNAEDDRKAMLRVVIEAISAEPIDVPKRMTKLRVQWKSGNVSELQLERPGSGDRHRHPAESIERIRDLVGAGHPDEVVADTLNRQGLQTGTGLQWTGERVLAVRRHYRIPRVAKDRQRMPPLPFQDPQGRYSVPGAEALLGVTRGTIYHWIRDSRVEASRGDFGTHRNVHWIYLDEAKIAELRKRAQPKRRK